MQTHRVIVIGAGVGGLVTALELASRGLAVTLVERGAAPGGKMREVAVGNARIDAGPTVLTMRWALDGVFEAAGTSLDDHITLKPAHVLARHAWSETERLDLYADRDESADAIGVLAGAREAQGYRDFCRRAQGIFETLDRTFIRAPKPSLPRLIRRIGPHRFGPLWRINPYQTLWNALGTHFRDPRLRQLFGRYATYCGSSPFSTPATLMLIAHCEREGVWLVEGGMHRIAVALASLAEARGVSIRYDSEAAEIIERGGRVAGLRLSDGERLDADAVVVNADAAAVSQGLFGQTARKSVPRAHPRQRSLAALTWNVVAQTNGFPLTRHNVFFAGGQYRHEFDDVFARRRLPRTPSVYVCAQDRDASGDHHPNGPERLLCIVNAPPDGDTNSLDRTEIEQCEETAFGLMARCGLSVTRRPESTVMTTPADFERLFPATGGALYGRASHGWMASFQRPGARSRMPGLYLAGGSTHPGPGVPMAAISGRLAAASLLADLGLT